MENSTLTVVDFAERQLELLVRPVRLSNGYRGAQDHLVAATAARIRGEYTVLGKKLLVYRQHPLVH